MNHDHDELTEVLHDIASTGYNDPEPKPLDIPRGGDSTWPNVTNDDFGRYYDYEVLDHGEITIIVPTCEAAKQWCYAHLPEWVDRWGAGGYKLETQSAKRVMRSMLRDKLFSDQDAAAAADMDARAGL